MKKTLTENNILTTLLLFVFKYAIVVIIASALDVFRHFGLELIFITVIDILQQVNTFDLFIIFFA